jgi:hypothetical protein
MPYGHYRALIWNQAHLRQALRQHERVCCTVR